MKNLLIVCVSFLLVLFFSSLCFTVQGSVFDANEDGKNDLLWHDLSGQKLYVWLMGEENQGIFLTEPLASDYIPVAVCDVDGDGNDDIFLKYMHKGLMEEKKSRIYLMDSDMVVDVFDYKQFKDLNLNLESIASQENDIVLLQNMQTQQIYLWQQPDLTKVEVPLKMVCTGAKQMMISGNSDFSGAIWEPFSEGKKFIFSPVDGEKILYVKFKNKNGQILAANPVTLLTDTKPAAISIDTPIDNEKVKTNAIEVKGLVSKACFKVLVNEKEAVLEGEHFSMGMILKNGANKIQITAIDLNGNISSSEPIKATFQALKNK